MMVQCWNDGLHLGPFCGIRNDRDGYKNLDGLQPNHSSKEVAVLSPQLLVGGSFAACQLFRDYAACLGHNANSCLQGEVVVCCTASTTCWRGRCYLQLPNELESAVCGVGQ